MSGALYWLDDRHVKFGSDRVVHVVRVGSEGHVSNHLQDLLVGVPGAPDLLEYLVRRMPAGLIDFPGEPQDGGPVGIFGLESLYPVTLVAVEANLLRNCGVDRQSIGAAVLVGDRHRDRFLILVT